MAAGLKPIDYYKGKLYQKEVNYNKFLDLSEEQLISLTKKVYRELEMLQDSLSRGSETSLNFERYYRSLQYVTNPLAHNDLKSFDERVAYLIMIADPNLVMYKEFLKLDLISASDIDKVENKKEKAALKELRNKTILSFENRVRQKIGFYDIKLLKYEEMFFKKFFSEKELITEVGSNNQDNLMIKAKSLKNFSSISDERYEELKNIAQIWLSCVPENFNSKVVTYSVTSQKKLLGLNNLAEQLTVFILLVDSDLDMLKIYEEESVLPKIKERITEQFGYFNANLIELEKKYYNRFCQNKKLCDWTKIKKD